MFRKQQRHWARAAAAIVLAALIGCGRTELMIHEQLAVLDEFRSSTWQGCRSAFDVGEFDQGPLQDHRYWRCKGQTSPIHPYTVTLIEREPGSGRAGDVILEYRQDAVPGFIGLTEPLFEMAGLHSEAEILKAREAVLAVLMTTSLDASVHQTGDFEQFTLRIASNHPSRGTATVHIGFR